MLSPQVAQYQLRSVTMHPVGKVFVWTAVAIATTVSVFLLTAYVQGRITDPVGVFAPLGVGIFVVVALLAGVNAERNVLQNGVLAEGRVVRTYVGRARVVLYEFEAANGQTFQGRLRTYRHEASAGDVIPVFYDSTDPRRSSTPMSRMFRVQPLGM